MSENRRKLERRRVDIAVVAHNGVDDEPLGKLVNIHEEGLMIMSDGPLQTDSIYQLELVLATPLDNESSIPVVADCLWQSPANTEGNYWVGFKIVEVSNKSVDLIGRLV
ncbi:PilZ domain-containing protein [Pseudoteredinibacter isoporae]|uniref:PilZ domain-containing protein n=1 Tax=Pseudoteredinibacter isoporae TaxID=570281 RepID=UPI00310856F1